MTIELVEKTVMPLHTTEKAYIEPRPGVSGATFFVISSRVDRRYDPAVIRHVKAEIQSPDRVTLRGTTLHSPGDEVVEWEIPLETESINVGTGLQRDVSPTFLGRRIPGFRRTVFLRWSKTQTGDYPPKR